LAVEVIGHDPFEAFVGERRVGAHPVTARPTVSALCAISEPGSRELSDRR